MIRNYCVTLSLLFVKQKTLISGSVIEEKSFFQLKLTLDRGLPEAEDCQQRALLCQSYSAITDLVLEGYQEQITSLSQSDQTLARKSEVEAAYANHRNTVISGLSTSLSMTFAALCCG